MASIYIHIPFCSKKCHYCNFYTHSSFKNRDQLIEAIINEIYLRKDYLGTQNLDSIYFGGGTPSLLTINELDSIFNQIQKYYSWNAEAEITLEANPDDISLEKLQYYNSRGINRLSLGIQSFNDEILQKLNRSHNAATAQNALDLIQNFSSFDLNIDLIFGIPGLTNSIWDDTLKTFFNLDITHLSAYFLTVEANTALDHLIRRNLYPKPIEEQGLTQWNKLHHLMVNEGYEQYEISNWAKNSKYSRHNLSYWNREPYLGVGPSSHSFNGNSRQWNINGIIPYIKGVNTAEGYFTYEKLSLVDQFNEFVMLGLRTKWGINIASARLIFGEDYVQLLYTKIEKFKLEKYFISNANAIQLNWDGIQMADGLAAKLFLD